MFKEMMDSCCGADGSPDFKKMTDFMEQHDRASLFDTVGWALFFIWVGAAWLLGFNLGIGLLGVGILTVGIQIARRLSAVRVEGFWVLVGLGFVVAGFWELWDIGLPLAPIVLIIAGLALLYWRIARPKHES